MQRGCTQCGECLNVCPVFRRHLREEYSPKAKRLLLEPVDGGASSLSWEEIRDLARLCAGCGRCKQACARKLSTSDLLADVRARHPHWTQYLWELWINRMGPAWLTLGHLAALAPEGLTPKALRSSVAAAKALAGEKGILPWARLRPVPEAAAGTVPVLLFSGCTAKNVRPQWTKKAEKLLGARGYVPLDASGFTCCGGTLHHAGQYETMNAMRQRNIALWRDRGRPRIAAFCASCHHGLAEYAEGPLTGDEAAAWKKSLTPLSALLAGARADLLPAKPAVYGYHQPCHWDTDKDMDFLSSILPGLEKGTGLCCGMGGILKMTDPDLSMDMARACADAFPEDAAQVLTGCSGCAMQLAAAARSGMSVRHWLDVVDA